MVADFINDDKYSNANPLSDHDGHRVQAVIEMPIGLHRCLGG
jgi:hypothetical protein